MNTVDRIVRDLKRTVAALSQHAGQKEQERYEASARAQAAKEEQERAERIASNIAKLLDEGTPEDR